MTEVISREKKIKGLPLSGGCAVGKVCLLNENRHSNLPMYRVPEGEGIVREKARVSRALDIAVNQIEVIREEVEQRIGLAEAEIFVAHKMILEDPHVQKELFDYVDKENINAEMAVRYVFDNFEQRLLAVEDDYMKTRATDFSDIKRRLLDAMGHMKPDLQCDKDHCQSGRNRIVVADELTPSLTIDIDPDLTIGFLTEHGGVNSHAAILARAMGIPAVSGLDGLRSMVGCGTELLIDGDTGEVTIWPTEATVSTTMANSVAIKGAHDPVDAVDGFKVMANVSLGQDIKEGIRQKAEGVGLYRTEFEIIAAERFFSEDELFERYARIDEAMAGKGVIYRVFDLGSDKSLPFMNIPPEENPALGWRGARLLLGKKDVLHTQARALARVSACDGGRIHVMYPMIVGVSQFLKIREEFMSAIQDIQHGEILHGIMFEVPSACLQARELFDVVDFASIGTNDLIQYLFAVDRDNDLVSYDYDPDRPVFWSVLKQIADAAIEKGKPLSVCGELAGYPKYISKFIEIGITSVSVSPRRIPDVRLAAKEILKSKTTMKGE